MSVSENSGSLLEQQELLTVNKLVGVVLEETLTLDGVGKDGNGEENLRRSRRISIWFSFGRGFLKLAVLTQACDPHS